MLCKLLVLAFVGYVASQGTPDPRCTEPDSVPAIRLPSETDCRRHYLCQAGLRHLMPACPTGMVFDPVTLACRPGTACLPIPPTTIPPVGTPGTEAPTTTEEETTDTSTTDTSTTESTLSTNPEDSTTESTSTISGSTTSSVSGGPSSAPPVFPTVPNQPPTVPSV